MKKLFLYFFMCLFLMSVVFAVNTLYVDDDGMADATSCDSSTVAYSTIQAAITAASDDDTINVCAGTYNENQIIVNKALAINGAGADTTIIDGGSVLLTETGLVRITSTGNVIFNGFTLKNAGGPTVSGGDGGDNKLNVGIYAQSSSSTAVYTISNNKIIGTNNANDEEDYGLYSHSGEEKLIFTQNSITKTGANSILIEKHPGETEISYNSLDAGIYGIDSIFYMTYGGSDITKLQKISYNTIDIGTGGTDRATAISFMSSYSGSGPIGDGKYTNIEISYNTINNLKDNKRGISLYNDGFSGGLAGEIKNSIVKGNKIYGTIGSTSNFGIRLAGYVTDTVVLDNHIENCGQSFYGTVGRNSPGVYPTGTIINNNEFINNFNGLVWDGTTTLNAENNYWGACDGPSAVGPGSGDKVSNNVDYNPWIGACVVNEVQDPTCVLDTNDVKLISEVNAPLCVKDVKVLYKVGSGSWQNQLVTKGADNKYTYTLSNSLTNPGDTILWKYSADDCYGHINEGVEKSTYVKLKTILSVDPATPDGNNDYYKTLPTFTLTNADASNKFYKWDALTTYTYTSPFVFDWESTLGGLEELHYWSTFTGCPIEPEQIYQVKVDVTSPEIKNLVPNENEITTNSKPLISAEIDDLYQSNSGIDKTSIVFKLDNEPKTVDIDDIDENSVKVSYQVTTDLTVSDHTVEIRAKDKAGNPETVKTWTFSYEPIYVDMDILSPEVKYYDSKKIGLNIKTYELEKDLRLEYNDNNQGWKLLCNKCNEYDRDKIFKDGEHLLGIRIIKNFAVANEQYVEFNIDSKKPKIIKIEPKNKAYSNGDNFKIKYSEEDLNNIKLHYGNDVLELSDCKESGVNKECTINVDLSAYNEQTIQYWFTVEDQINVVDSKKYSIKVDTVLPELTVNSPIMGIPYDNKILLDVSVNEKVKAIEYNDNNKGYRRLCGNCAEYKKDKTLSKGEHNFKIRAVDYAGNIDEEERIFTII